MTSFYLIAVLPSQADWLEEHLLPFLGAVPAPAGSLPPGVHEAPTGELLVKGNAIPAGWDFRQNRDEWMRWEQARCFNPVAWYEVRPVPQPAAELVAWWEAVGRTLPDGQIIRRVGCTELGPWVNTSDGTYESRLDVANAVDASGRVSVLVQNGEES